MTRTLINEHAIALADHFVATILEEDPELLVSSLDGLEDDEIRLVARRLAVFRLALVEELSAQPLDDEFDEEDEEEEADEEEADEEDDGEE